MIICETENKARKGLADWPGVVTELPYFEKDGIEEE